MFPGLWKNAQKQAFRLKGGLNFSDLLKFWQSKNDVNLINVSYEELIKNNESEIKRIINDCKLDWEENCLHYYKNKN